MKRISAIFFVTLILLLVMSVSVFAEGETDNKVSAGHGSTYVIKNDGSLWGWGNMYTGNGNGYKEEQISPAKILEDVKAVSASNSGGIAVKKDNTLWAWGSFTGYPIADGSENPKFLYPVQIMEDVKLASLGKTTIAVIKNDDSLWICGGMTIGDGTEIKADSKEGFVNIMNDVKDVFMGWRDIYIIKNDNTLWGYGDNSEGELGILNYEDQLSPVKILDDVIMVRQFSNTGFAIRSDYSLYTWGQGGNDGIYTEDGWLDDVVSPYKVMDHVRDVTACHNASGVLVIKTDQSLWGWGGQWNDEGVQKSPYKYADSALGVSNGERHSAVIMGDNTLWTMGGNYRSALGYENDTIHYSPLTKILDDIQDEPDGWAYEEVEKAIGQQLIPIDMQNNYNHAITREEFCILAIRMIEVRSSMSIDDYLKAVGVEIAPKGTFIDCDTKEVRAAKVLGITDGVSENEFAPDNLLNREQAAKFLTTTAMACGRNVTLATPEYADINDISQWAKPYTGYVNDIGVMTGVGHNRFNPDGGFQRQQAFMTMYRIWQAIDEVNPDNVLIGKESSAKAESKSGVDLDSILKEVSNEPYDQDYIAYIEGTSTDKEGTTILKYDVYYKDANININTYYDGKTVSNSIYNETADLTYTHSTLGTNYGEVLEGNWLPLRFLNIETFSMMQNDAEVESFEWRYESLNDAQVIYTKTLMKGGVLTEQWYSTQYKIPVKFHQEWAEPDDYAIIDWQVVSIDESKVLDSHLFDIPTD